MEHLPQLVEEYKKNIEPRDDVDLLFYSLDNSEDEMKDFLGGASAPFVSVDYTSASKGRIKSLAEVDAGNKGVPLFMLFNAEGKSVFSDDSLPSMAQLEKLLKK